MVKSTAGGGISKTLSCLFEFYSYLKDGNYALRLDLKYTVFS